MATRADSIALNKRPIVPSSAPPQPVTMDSNGTASNSTSAESVMLSPVVLTRGLYSYNVDANLTLTAPHIVQSTIIIGTTTGAKTLTLPTAAEVVRYLDANRLLPSTNLATGAITLPNPILTNAALPVLMGAFDFMVKNRSGSTVTVTFSAGNYWHATDDGAGVTGGTANNLTNTQTNYRGWIVSTNPAQIDWFLA